MAKSALPAPAARTLSKSADAVEAGVRDGSSAFTCALRISVDVLGTRPERPAATPPVICDLGAADASHHQRSKVCEAARRVSTRQIRHGWP